MWLSYGVDTRARKKSALRIGTPRRFITVRHASVLLAGRKKAARNAAKCHYSRAYRIGVLALMVAEPIQKYVGGVGHG